MGKLLISWIGATDLRAPAEGDTVGLGPIAQALQARAFDAIFLISNYPAPKVEPFLDWLRGQSIVPLRTTYCTLSSPTHFGEIYTTALEVCTRALALQQGADPQLTFHLSPGTPAMAAVWIILGKTRFPAELIESSRQHGVQTASVPFDISADFIPDLLRKPDEQLRRASGELPPEAPEFEQILHRSRVMERLLERARRVAPRNVPVLIEGESGTGKELLARAIHQASPRRSAAFVAVNCGAIPPALVESALFGHEKGAFTGAAQPHRGYFEQAHQGTLLLDEVGELPLEQQVKLLRVLQEGEVVSLGAVKPKKIDVRVIAATHRNLAQEVAAGRFREDLFYRLAVAILKVPPLRERSSDVSLLATRLLEKVNRESQQDPGYQQKKLSAAAKNLLLGHSWPGNVRELLNTLRRAALWSEGPIISGEDIRDALLPVVAPRGEDLFQRPLGEGFKLEELLAEVARCYLGRAMDEAAGNKTRAAKLLGLSSYQTLSNWLQRYRIPGAVEDQSEPCHSR